MMFYNIMSTFFKGLILVCMIIIILTVSCTHNSVPDYDMLSLKDEGCYFKYYFRNPDYPGQLKMRPDDMFKSLYRCVYRVLPNTKVGYSYNQYLLDFTESKYALLSKRGKLENGSRQIHEEENMYDDKFKNAFNARYEVYNAIRNIMNCEASNFQENQKYEKMKERAINRYVNNQMPDISKDNFSSAYWENKLRYIYDNYDRYVNPTDKSFHRSSIMDSENSIITKYVKDCTPLSVEKFDEVKFLYELLPDSEDTYETFTKRKITLMKSLQDSFYDLKEYLTQNELYEKENAFGPNDRRNTFNMLQNRFVTGNENERSFLIRMQKLGVVGIDKVNSNIDKYEPGKYDIILDIHSERK